MNTPEDSILGGPGTCSKCGKHVPNRSFHEAHCPLPSPDKSAGGMVFDLQRSHDLIKHVRAILHEDSLISDEEYVHLCDDNEAVKRLVSYDDLRTQLQDITDQFFARSQELAGLDKDYGVLEQQYSDTCVQLAQLKQERDELVGEMQTLTKRLEWVNEPLKGNETAEHIKKLYHRALLNHVHDESEIKEMVRPYLTEFELEGDSYGVPDFVDWVRLTVARLASPASSPTQGAEHGETLTHPPAGA